MIFPLLVAAGFVAHDRLAAAEEPDPAGAAPPRLAVHAKTFVQMTRITFESDRAVPFFTLLISGPGEPRSSRIVVRPEGKVTVEGKIWPVTVGDGVVRHVRVSPGDVTTFTIELGDAFASYRTFSADRPARFVVDLHRAKPSSPDRIGAGTPPAGPEGAPAKPEKTSGRLLLVIDPAHGGEHPGSVGVSGIREKDWVLSLGRTIQRAAASLSPPIEVVLTREADYHLPFRERAAVGNRGRAVWPVYVSLHLSPRDRDGKRAVQVHVHSYAAIIGGTPGKAVSIADFPVVNGTRRTTLWDFQQFPATAESQRLGESLKKALSSSPDIHTVSVRQTPLAELSGLAVPAVAVEFGFLGDAAGEAAIKDAAFQARIARFLLNGIRDAFGAGSPVPTRPAPPRDG